MSVYELSGSKERALYFDNKMSSIEIHTLAVNTKTPATQIAAMTIIRPINRSLFSIPLPDFIIGDTLN